MASSENESAWQCPECSERIEDSFEICWNCGTSIDGRQDPSFEPEGTPEDRADPLGRAGPAGRSRPKFWLLAGMMYGAAIAFTPRPPGSTEDPIEELSRNLPLWASICLLGLAFVPTLATGCFIRRFILDGTPAIELKSGPAWFKTLFTFKWPLHWWANVFWAFLGGGVALVMAAPFSGARCLLNAIWTLSAVAGLWLGFRLAGGPLKRRHGKR